MDKEAKLLECLEIISKNPRRNAHGLLSVLQQLIELNPKLGLRCWEDCIKAHLPAIKKEFSRKRFNTDSLGHILITKMECQALEQEYFVYAIKDFLNNPFLINTIYTQWPMLWNYVKKIKILLICKAVNQSFW